MTGNGVYDYVIVGGGSAGCVLAGRLSEDAGCRVCLIEAGPPDRNPLIHIPAALFALMSHPRLNWRYRTAPQRRMDGASAPVPRGRTLGGSSSINGMVYIRGHRSDYDDWAASGLDGAGGGRTSCPGSSNPSATRASPTRRCTARTALST